MIFLGKTGETPSISSYTQVRLKLIIAKDGRALSTVAGNKKFPYCLHCTRMKCSVPVHGTNTGLDHVRITYAFRFTLGISVLCEKVLSSY